MCVGPIYKGKFDIHVRCTVQSPLISLASILNLMTKKGVTKRTISIYKYHVCTKSLGLTKWRDMM